MSRRSREHVLFDRLADFVGWFTLQKALLSRAELAVALRRPLRHLQHSGNTYTAWLALRNAIELLNEAGRLRPATLLCGWLDGGSGRNAHSVGEPMPRRTPNRERSRQRAPRCSYRLPLGHRAGSSHPTGRDHSVSEDARSRSFSAPRPGPGTSSAMLRVVVLRVVTGRLEAHLTTPPRSGRQWPRPSRSSCRVLTGVSARRPHSPKADDLVHAVIEGAASSPGTSLNGPDSRY